jgi:hypothetical protein
MTQTTKKFPTGLVPGWKDRIPKTKGDTQNRQRASSPLGGLSDDDAHAERPDNIGIGNRYKTQKNEVCPIYFGPDEILLIHSAGMKLKIIVDDSDPDSIEYIKPKPKVKVGVLSCVYVCK